MNDSQNYVEFSVVIPLYNRERTILRALNSVLEQTHRAFEVIVVDDGSSDEGALLVEGINDSRVTLIKQDNAGVSVARNIGIANSKNPYIAFLDSDDTWEPGYLECLSALINKYPAMGAYSTAYYVEYPDKSRLPARFRGLPDETVAGKIDNYFECAVSGSNPLWTGSTCIPRPVLIEMKGFPEGVYLHEDLYLWAKIVVNYPIVFCPVSLATYHKFEEDSTCLNRIVREKDFLFFDFLSELIDQEKASSEQLIHIKRYLNQWLVRDAIKAGCASDAEMVKACLKLYRRDSFFEQLNLMAIYLYVRFPGKIQRGARSMGYRFKSLVRKFTMFRLASST